MQSIGPDLKSQGKQEGVMKAENLKEFGPILDGLEPGQEAFVPYHTFTVLFPPGEPDDGARKAAFRFAQEHGRRIENRPGHGGVAFIRDAPPATD